MVLPLIFVFLLGIFVGSFSNCVIYRLYREESFLQGRSYCPKCQHTLAWYDLVPLLSFLILNGRCRYCGEEISPQYPLVELSTGIIFLLVASSQFVTTLYLFIISSFLVIIFVYDLKNYIIPDKIVFPAIGVTLLYNFFRLSSLAEAKALMVNLGLAILPSLFFLAIILFSRGKWMGLGDFKLAIFMGFFLGWPVILTALFFAFIIGAIIGLGLIILGEKTFKSQLPFGPFLVTGTFLGLFWGQKLVNWYLSSFIL